MSDWAPKPKWLECWLPPTPKRAKVETARVTMVVMVDLDTKAPFSFLLYS